ncbi:DsrE/DsrF/DrsH-like family protein [bacterium]|nr:DsrE/DsrF/DrsH-like family protein [bacterium]
MSKLAIVVNHDDPGSVFPAFILGSSAVASGDEVIMFYTPGGSLALKKGVLENMSGKGLPVMSELVEGYQLLGGRIMACELCFEAKGFTHEDLRDGIEVVGATTFISEIKDYDLAFTF